MSTLHIKRKLKELGQQSRTMRWSRQLRFLSDLIEDSSTPKDFFFEFWCYLTAVNAIRLEVANVRLEVPQGAAYAVWPLKPGAANNFSYFSFTIGNSTLGIFPGVEFPYRGINSSFAPDISIRTALSTTGRPRIYAVWDAKYRSRPARCLTRDEVYTFSAARGLLPISRSIQLRRKIQGIVGAPCFRSCGLITNGLFSAEHDQTLLALGVLETARFGTRYESTRP